MSLAEFRPSGFFVFRTALLPFDDIHAWSAECRASSAALEERSEVWHRDMAQLRESLRRALRRPEIREAIYLASPVLHEQIKPWLEDASRDPGARALRSAARYYLRMAGRPTPFGLFAGNSHGRIADMPRLELAPRGAYRRHTRVDHDYLAALVARFASDADLRRELTWRPNSSLFRFGDQLRYSEARMRGMERQYHLVTVDLDEPLERVLELAADGASFATLVEALVDPEIERADAEEYIHEIISAQLLEPDLEPPLTGDDPLEALTASLAAHPSGQAWSGVLGALLSGMRAVDGERIGIPPERYEALSEPLAALPARPEAGRLFQVDMFKPAPGAALPVHVVQEIAPAMDALVRLAALARTADREVFETFRRQFVERYGEREMPFTEVLDEEMGLGFMKSNAPTSEPSPLLNGLPFPDPSRLSREPWTPEEEYILPRLCAALQSGSREIALEPSDLPPLSSDEATRLPDAMSLAFKLHARDADALARGDYQITLINGGGPSGARMLGRFCHLDGELRDAVREHLAEEERLAPEAVFAEIVHRPQGRIGNVLARPLLRRYEIPFLGRSGAPPEQQIPLTDLWLSVVGERIVLRSKRLNCEVVPRLTTAHNYTALALGVYQFLGRLQTQQSLSGVAWRWGRFEHLPFLPALRVGRVRIAPARWRLERETIRSMALASGPERFSRVQELRAELKWPRFVGLVEGDNVLTVDLDNALSVDTLVDLIDGTPSCHIREMEQSPDELPVAGPEGRFVSEFLIPMVRRSGTDSVIARALGAAPFVARTPGPERHGPGSRWIYLKLYAGRAGVDALLRDDVGGLIEACRRTGGLDRWFFIRYADPEWHLRLRLCAVSREAQVELRTRVEQHFAGSLRSGRVWRMQFDTYDPEQVRYGGPEGLELAERLFQVDSEVVLALLGLTRGDDGMDLRWRLCLVGLDRLLGDFSIDLPRRHDILVDLSARFDREFGVEGAFKHVVRDRFRALRDPLTRLLLGETEEAEELRVGLGHLDRRSREQQSWVAELRSRAAQGRLNQPIEALVTSLLHMHANRMLRGAARAQEMLLYHFLERIYRSLLARGRGIGEAVAR